MSKGIIRRDAPAGGPWHSPGIPGVYATGVVVPLESTGRTEDEMRAILAAHPDLDFEIVDMEAPEPETAPESPKAAKACEQAPVAAEEG
jgi:hypothetical protein